MFAWPDSGDAKRSAAAEIRPGAPGRLAGPVPKASSVADDGRARPIPQSNDRARHSAGRSRRTAPSCGAEKSHATSEHGHQRDHVHEHGGPRPSRCGEALGHRRASRHRGAAARVDGDRHQAAVSGRRVRVDVQLLHPGAASCRRGGLQPHRGRAGRAQLSVDPRAVRAGRDHPDGSATAGAALDGGESCRGA